MKPTRFLLQSVLILGAYAVLLVLDKVWKINLPSVVHEAFWAVLATLILVAILDALTSRRLPAAQIKRMLPEQFFVGRNSQVGLEIHHTRTREWLITLYDHYPNTWQANSIPVTIKLQPQKLATIFYNIMPPARGDALFTDIEQIYYSKIGFWLITKKIPATSLVKVMPDFAQVLGADITGLERWMNLLGAKRTPRRGFGQDFHQLREYREGDTIKQIDWKATARKHALVSREYQDERDQQIVFLLDCSRNMRSTDGQLSHFDHALNAMLLLTYTALRHDDAVGVVTFSNETPRFITPRKGVAQLGHLIKGIYDVMPTHQTADYSQAVDILFAQQKRRALVIVLTNLAEEGEIELLANLKRISRRHRILVASLKEEVLDQVRHQNIQHFEDALDYAGAVSYQRDMDKLYQKLMAYRVPFLNTYPHKLGPELISQYLKIKRDGAW
ncbi:DUF58 domain-containing protein [Neisseria sp. Ec49-e6-T10]|uniref:DUF58 domain-containing protein n=1 Tax=Neisseria sp. Ec49-e6-T10 TaxID=3140744 RepID=UPI003EBC0979